MAVTSKVTTTSVTAEPLEFTIPPKFLVMPLLPMTHKSMETPLLKIMLSLKMTPLLQTTLLSKIMLAFQIALLFAITQEFMATPQSMNTPLSKTRLAFPEMPKSMNILLLQVLVKLLITPLFTAKLPYVGTSLSQVMLKSKTTPIFMTTFVLVNTPAFIVTRHFVTKSMFLVSPTSPQVLMAMKPSQVTPLSIPQTMSFASNQTMLTTIAIFQKTIISPIPNPTTCGITTSFMAILENSFAPLKPATKDAFINNSLNLSVNTHYFYKKGTRLCRYPSHLHRYRQNTKPSALHRCRR